MPMRASTHASTHAVGMSAHMSRPMSRPMSIHISAHRCANDTDASSVVRGSRVLKSCRSTLSGHARHLLQFQCAPLRCACLLNKTICYDDQYADASNSFCSLCPGAPCTRYRTAGIFTKQKSGVGPGARGEGLEGGRCVRRGRPCRLVAYCPPRRGTRDRLMFGAAAGLLAELGPAAGPHADARRDGVVFSRAAGACRADRRARNSHPQPLEHCRWQQATGPPPKLAARRPAIAVRVPDAVAVIRAERAGSVEPRGEPRSRRGDGG